MPFVARATFGVVLTRAVQRRTQPLPRTVALGAVLLAVAALCLACTPSGADTRHMLVGKWQSSRLTTPLYLHDNGEWEIKQDNGLVLQYGLWAYHSKNLIWTFKHGTVISREVNPVVTLKPSAFTLRENDRTLTTFTRLMPTTD